MLNKLRIVKLLVYTALITLFYLPTYINFTLSDLNQPLMFEDEICSYNGMANTYSNSSYINCTCQDEFHNDPNLQRLINGVPVQCSYERKRRFIALFLSIFLPFGIDYLYLGRYLIFIIILFMCCLTLFGNCVRFAVSPHKDYFKNKYNLFFIILAIVMLFWWILNIALIWTGVIKDGNGIDTVNDLYFLININNG